ncbi:hypothetical protein FRB91_001502 [Serendipita sp. 411]|nr:hypothetical protein FRC15_004047 [Serendipita sp. 397]KAG8778475.1 hypothetical protein FRC16_003831 [Serendipita sp. 398]KAG8843375.1 hypothetical protein FRC20_003983 [Serendipita sp. 405]KAG8845761.1 hypothetical protein FRB91_001502 [Serendipita sp. 411]
MRFSTLLFPVFVLSSSLSPLVLGLPVSGESSEQGITRSASTPQVQTGGPEVHNQHNSTPDLHKRAATVTYGQLQGQGVAHLTAEQHRAVEMKMASWWHAQNIQSGNWVVDAAIFTATTGMLSLDTVPHDTTGTHGRTLPINPSTLPTAPRSPVSP